MVPDRFVCLLVLPVWWGGGCVGWSGWHAVGVLGRCALVPGCWLCPCGVGAGGVGGLVVNCIVDASIFLLVLPRPCGRGGP